MTQRYEMGPDGKIRHVGGPKPEFVEEGGSIPISENTAWALERADTAARLEAATRKVIAILQGALDDTE